MNTQGNETELQAKIRESLKRHPLKPGKAVHPNGRTYKTGGVSERYRIVAKECGCSIGSVQNIDRIERDAEIGKQIRKNPPLTPMPFNTPQVPDVKNLDIPGSREFQGWVYAFGRLSLQISSLLQIARCQGAAMPASWLSNLRDICETAQCQAEQDRDLKKLWPNGAPAGSGNFGHLLEEGGGQ